MVKKPTERPKQKDAFSRAVGTQSARKLKAKRNPATNVWFGFGLFGLIGWSVAIPTLIGAALGLWIDRHYPGERSWTLALLVLGLCLGCANAWHWVAQEDKDIRKEAEEDNHE